MRWRWKKILIRTAVDAGILVALNFGYKAMLPYWYQKLILLPDN